VLSRPAGLYEADLAALLASAWGITVTSLEYRPVGFGSHHWQAGTDWFVTVDEPAPDSSATNTVDELCAALGTAQDLSAGGLAFVVAPIATRDGRPLARLQRFAVAVYPYVEGRSFDWDAWSAGEDDNKDGALDNQTQHRRAVLDLVIALHTTTIPTRARHVDLGIPYRLGLTTADGEEHGPYSRRAAVLLARHRTVIQRRLAEYDELTRLRPSTVVITHGEPHPGNTMLTAGGWRLIDWDTVRLAPPERDLWSLPDVDRYADATGYRPDPRLLELFRRRWDLADLAVTAERFRHPHTGDADDDRSWEILEELGSAL
jgi:spectinomycin phosphotransferase/16S rRNA (guanine(1405)-N(7))-methyltransferase